MAAFFLLISANISVISANISAILANISAISAKISTISAKNDDKEYFQHYLESIPVKNSYKKFTVASWDI